MVARASAATIWDSAAIARDSAAPARFSAAAALAFAAMILASAAERLRHQFLWFERPDQFGLSGTS